MFHTVSTLQAAGQVDLVGKWNSLWSSVKSALGSTGGALNFLALLGFIMIIVAIVTFIYKKRKGQGAGVSGSGPIWFSAILGGILIAPDVLIPIALMVIQLVVNLMIMIGNNIGLW